MKTIIIIALVIIILFAIKKNYKELLIFLIISLILDWIFVNVFSVIPFIRAVAISVGSPILLILIYVLIELICMGIFYYTLQKYNYTISLIIYLVIHIMINKFYMMLSGSILLDLLFNFVIGIIIITVYKKNIAMEDIKWFAIIGMIIDTILTFSVAHLWKIVGGTIFIYIWIFGTLFMPYIMGVILSTIVICLIRKKLIKKDKKLKILVYAIIIVICGYTSVKLGYSFLSYVSAKPDKVYTRMKEMNDSERLLGLSKDEVVTLLGEPLHKSTDNPYIYDAGKITNYLFFGEREFYDFFVWFDENDRVKSTSIELPRGG